MVPSHMRVDDKQSPLYHMAHLHWAVLPGAHAGVPESQCDRGGHLVTQAPSTKAYTYAYGPLDWPTMAPNTRALLGNSDNSRLGPLLGHA